MRWYVCDECHQQWPSDELSALQLIQHEDETGAPRLHRGSHGRCGARVNSLYSFLARTSAISSVLVR